MGLKQRYINKMAQKDQTTKNAEAETNEMVSLPSSSKVGSSTVAGMVIGFLLGGPVPAVLLGIGSGYAATKEGAAGDIARAGGDVAIAVKERATKINEEHHIMDKSSIVIEDLIQKISNFEKKNHWFEKFCIFISDSAKNLANYIQSSNNDDVKHTTINSTTANK